MSVGTVNGNLDILELSRDTGLGLLKVHVLDVELFDLGLSFVKAGSKLHASSLDFLSAGKTLRFVLGTPHLGLGVSLGEEALDVSLTLRFLIEVLTEGSNVVLKVAVLSEDGSAAPALIISELPAIIKLVGEGKLELGEVGQVRLSFLKLADKIGVLNGELLLGGIEVAEGAVSFIELGVGVAELVLELLGGLLSSSLVTSKGIHGSLGIIRITLHGILVLLSPGLHLVEMINVLRELSNSIVVLLAKHGESRLMLDVGFFKITAELGELTLTLLVQLDLGSSGTTSFIETVSEVTKFPSESSLGLLGLGTGLAFMFNLNIEFFNAGLEFLGLLVALVDQDGLIVDLGAEGGNFLVLALKSVLEFLEVALEVRYSFLGKLEVPLNLPLGLLNLTTELLLTLKRIFELIELAFKLRLELVEVVALVLNTLDVLSTLLVAFLEVLLFLVDLADQFFLVGNLLIEVADLLILGALVLFSLLDGELKIFEVLLQGIDLLLSLPLAIGKLVLGLLLTGKALRDFIKLGFDFTPGGLELRLLFKHLADTTLAGFNGLKESVPFLLEDGIDGLEFLPLGNGATKSILSLNSLLFEGIELILDTADIEPWLEGIPETIPGPGLHVLELPDVALNNEEGDTLILELLVVLAALEATAPRLEPSHEKSDTAITDFLN